MCAKGISTCRGQCFDIDERRARSSRSCSKTQWMPCLRIAGLSFMCCDEKRPFFLSNTFTDRSTTAIAIINTVRMIVSAILLNFVPAKIMQISQI